MNKKDIKPWLVRCTLLLKEFDLSIKDKRGSKNLIADHLSYLGSREQESTDEIKEVFSDDKPL